MKIKITLALIIFLAAVAMLPAQQENSTFYKISGKGTKPSYIFGTIDIADAAFFKISDSVFIALNNSDFIATQLITDTVEQRLFKEMVTLPDQKTYLDHVNNMKFGIVDEQFVKENTTAWEYNQYYPLYIQRQLQLIKARESQAQTLQEFIIMLAEEQGKEILPYLSATEKAQFIKNIPITVQSDILTEYVQHLNNNKNRKSILTNFYLKGNISGIQRYFLNHRHHEEWEQVIQPDANIISQKIKELSSSTSSGFFIADAEMLAGPEGILNQLRKQGFKITSIQAYDKKDASSATVFNQDSEEGDTAENMQLLQPEEVLYYDLNTEYTDEYFSTTIPDWITTTSQSGAFTIKMPQEPDLLIEKVPAEDGFISVNMYRYEDKAINTFYLVSYNDYPPAFRPESRKDFFRDVIGSVIRRMGGSLLMEKDISTAQYKAREIEVEVDEDYFVRARFYLVNNRLYQVIVGGSDKRAYSPENEAFLRSFKLINQKLDNWYLLNVGVAKVKFPAVPVRQEKLLNTPAGPVYSYDYKVNEQKTQLNYLANYTIYDESFEVKDKEQFYNGIIYNTAATINGVVIKDEAVKYGGHTGRSVAIGVGQSTVYRLIYIYYKNRLLQVMLQGNEDSAYSEYAEKFISSFALDDYEY